MMMMVMMILMTMLAKMMMITSQNDVQVHFNEAIRKAVEEKDRRIQELELSLSNQVTFPIESSSGFDAHDCWLPFRHQCRFISF